MRSPRRILRGLLRRLAHRLAPSELETALRFLERPKNPIFPRRNVEVVREVPRASVLVLAPHPDDEAIGMGGTLAMHVENGSTVTVLYLTDGGGVGGDREALVAVRRMEARDVGKELGIRQIFWENPDTRLTNDAQNVRALVEVIEESKPALLYAPSIFDTHYDHFATNGVLAGALGELRGLEALVLGYEVWDTIPFANYLVDVSAVIERKDGLLAHYRKPHESTDFTGLCRKRANVHYVLQVNSERASAERGYAEAFLRFDGDTWRELFRAWVETLREQGNDLPTHLTTGG